MGKRGPKPKTDGEKHQPVIVELGPCPAFLTGEARKEFARIKAVSGGRIAGTDRAGLIRYCAMWSQWVDMQAKAKHEPYVTDGEKGPRVNPFWTAYRQLHRDLLTTEDKFVLTPACRSRVGADTTDEADTPEDQEMFG